MKAVKFFLGFVLIVFQGISQEYEETERQDLGPLLEPDPVPFSFNTPGWYFLGAILLFLLIFAIYNQIKNYKHNAYRRKALEQISRIEASSGTISNSDYLNKLMAVLKLVALQAYGRMTVASMSGKEWWSFLESKGKDTPFSEYGDVLTASLYEDKTTDPKMTGRISELTKKWVKTHA